MQENASLPRRKFLTASATVASGVGVACAVTPFLSSWKPSKKAQAAGSSVEVDVSKLEFGQMIVVEWRGRPIWVVRRSQDQLNSLDRVIDLLRDPESEKSDQPSFAINKHRSSNPEYLVLIGVCTHLGCAPLYRPDLTDEVLGNDWQGGFFCPCHGSKFDLAGRVYKDMPAPINLPVPPYHFKDAVTLIVGEEFA